MNQLNKQQQKCSDFKDKKIPVERIGAKVRILYKKGDTRDMTNYKPISLLFPMYKLFTWTLPKLKEMVLNENQTKKTGRFQQRLLYS